MLIFMQVHHKYNKKHADIYMLIFMHVHHKYNKKLANIYRVKEICNSKYIDIQEIY